MTAGADVNAPNSVGSTPLHIAAVNRRAAVVAAMLRLAEGRIQLSARNSNGLCSHCSLSLRLTVPGRSQMEVSK